MKGKSKTEGASFIRIQLVSALDSVYFSCFFIAFHFVTPCGFLLVSPASMYSGNLLNFSQLETCMITIKLFSKIYSPRCFLSDFDFRLFWSFITFPFLPNFFFFLGRSSVFLFRVFFFKKKKTKNQSKRLKKNTKERSEGNEKERRLIWAVYFRLFMIFSAVCSHLWLTERLK